MLLVIVSEDFASKAVFSRGLLMFKRGCYFSKCWVCFGYKRLHTNPLDAVTLNVIAVSCLVFIVLP